MNRYLAIAAAWAAVGAVGVAEAWHHPHVDGAVILAALALWATYRLMRGA
ncbi:hypothetical protein [Roseospirillum parvum]|uniref:Uncharacterized protein n=1 Tax=Roseospirillum parvum TaxID=83401 RepID=A0A1G8GHE7_9PROT|nr:hypothetical protein [Roseospirillum parvum]SDH93707.1 hypothetical protein SAMN05421742_12710 [Roseospirillum parvum]